jgi:hypothetical protein
LSVFPFMLILVCVTIFRPPVYANAV